eukprot:1175965-Prorocentrum_minimum.AAC.1
MRCLIWPGQRYVRFECTIVRVRSVNALSVALSHHRWVLWEQNDSCILTASGDSSIKLWDVERRRQIYNLQGHFGSVKTLALRPSSDADSLVFASGDRTSSAQTVRARLLILLGALLDFNFIATLSGSTFHSVCLGPTPAEHWLKRREYQPVGR